VSHVVDLDSIRVKYGTLTAVDELSLSVHDGELFCLLGPSGCGKTTTLRTIAGFESPAAGEVVLNDQNVTELPPYNRDCATVFQDWALFPNKTVIENVAFGQKMAGVSKGQRREHARENLATVEMAEYADSRPAELSGGQKQRVALARSLAVNPEVLLLDEPLSNLDKRLRETMQLEIKEIHEQLEMPMVYVTHDQAEAFTLADRIGIMNDGELVQTGDPESVYDNPTNQFVESFLGTTNFLSGSIAHAPTAASSGTGEPLVAEFPAIETQVKLSTTDIAVGDSVSTSVRPEIIDLLPLSTDTAASADGGTTSRPDRESSEPGRERSTSDTVVLTGTVSDVIYRGSNIRYHVIPDNDRKEEVNLFVERSVTQAPDLSPSDPVQLSWSPTAAYYFGPDGARIRQ